MSDPHQFEPHQFDHSVRDGIFDGSADDIEDLDHNSFNDFNDFSRSRRHRGHHDMSGAPSWVKAFIWAGTLLAIAGMGVVIFGVLSPGEAPEPFSTRLTPAFPTVALPPGFPTGDLPADLQPPAARDFPGQPPTPTSVGGPNLPLGFGLFFAGFVLAAIGTLGRGTSTRR